MYKYLIILLASLILLCSCNTLETTEKNNAQENLLISWKINENNIAAQYTKLYAILQPRLQQYWEQYSHREWDKNYLMQTPEGRKGFTRQSYASYYRGGWKVNKITLKSVDFKSENEVKVKTLLEMEKAVTKDKSRAMASDTWLKIDGVWYHKFYDPLIKLRQFKSKKL